MSKFLAGRAIRMLLLCLALVGLLTFAARPSTVKAGSGAFASTAGFGAAFGYAQTIGAVSFTQAGSIANGVGSGTASVPGFSSAGSMASSAGPSAAFAQAIGSPFGSAAFVQATSFFGGSAFGAAGANP